MDKKINEKIFKNPASEFSRWCFDWLETFVQVVVLMMFVWCFFFRTMNVSGESMMNTLFDGDKIFVLKWGYVPTDGDVVTITHGQIYDEPIVKRIIATEGETLKIDFSDGSVWVNGEKLNETYIKEPMWLQEDGEIPEVIPKGYSFVMGDNRNNSLDSRSKAIGLINNNNIIGKVKYILLPYNRFREVK